MEQLQNTDADEVLTGYETIEPRGTTVTDWVRGRRLEHCRNDLLDPRYARTSIGAIAARWGLIDSSYFSRLFKTIYGAAA